MHMAMAPPGQAEQERDHQHGQPNSSHHTDAGTAARSVVGDYAKLVAVILFALLTMLALALALKAAVRYLVGRSRRARRGRANITDREMPAVEAPAPPPPPPALVYSAASTNLAGAAAESECTICLTEFADGDAVRVMPACRHSFHASCIERLLAGGRRSSCPTCRAPAAVATGAAAAAPQPDETTNRREPYSGAGDCSRHVAFVILAALSMTTMALAMISATVRYFLGRGRK